MTHSSTSIPRQSFASATPSDKRYKTDRRRMSKDILVFCDGTGKDGTQDGDKSPTRSHGAPQPSEKEVYPGESPRHTNIYRAYKLVEQRRIGSDGRVRMAHYVPGVGAGSAIKNPFNLLARVFGATIVEAIVNAYLYISEHYREGDDIYLFGYSRGAFVARKVASLIYRIGLNTKDRESLIKSWSQHEKPVPWNSLASKSVGKDIPIKCLVAWDTVGAIFTKHYCTQEEHLLGIPDTELPPNVEHAFHALAFHENRKLFRATLFSPNDKTKLKEVWFPGAHADVGGGGGKRQSSLPNISLLWVIIEMARFIKLESGGIHCPDLTAIIPTDAYHESSAPRRALDKCETRLESALLKKNSLVHESVASLRDLSLGALDPRPRKKSRLLTINDLNSIHWDIAAYLVKWTNLELWKNSEGSNGGYRSRVPSFMNPIINLGRPPRLSDAPLPASQLRPAPVATRQYSSSVFMPKTQPNDHAPVSDPLESSHRSRKHSSASTHTSSRRHNPPPVAPVPPIAPWSAIGSSSGGSGHVAASEFLTSRSHRTRASSRSSQVSIDPPDIPAERRHRSGRERGASKLNQQISLAA